jgi:diguanylate cyclase (GGDEF)-like protein
MISAPLSAGEPARLASVEGLKILDTPAEERFDRVTRVAQRVFGVPVAMVTILDRERQWFKSRQGLYIAETPRTISFCAHAILSDETLVVPDAIEDERFRDNPWVVGEPKLRFYAGHPLHSADGSRVGALEIGDREPKELKSEDLKALRDLAGFVQDELHAMRFSRIQGQILEELPGAGKSRLCDPESGLWSEAAIREILRRELNESRREENSLAVIAASLDGLGTPVPASVVEIAQRLRSSIRYSDCAGRLSENRFLLVLTHTTREGALMTAARIRKAAAEASIPTMDESFRATLSLGIVVSGGPGDPDANALVQIAESAREDAASAGGDRAQLANG